MRKLIHVRQEHIDAVPRHALHSAASCPVARAIKDAIPDSNPLVFKNKTFLDHTAVDNPRSVRRFVDNFDDPSANGKPAKPFNFYLNLPEGFNA